MLGSGDASFILARLLSQLHNRQKIIYSVELLQQQSLAVMPAIVEETKDGDQNLYTFGVVKLLDQTKNGSASCFQKWPTTTTCFQEVHKTSINGSATLLPFLPPPIPPPHLQTPLYGALWWPLALTNVLFIYCVAKKEWIVHMCLCCKPWYDWLKLATI